MTTEIMRKILLAIVLLVLVSGCAMNRVVPATLLKPLIPSNGKVITKLPARFLWDKIYGAEKYNFRIMRRSDNIIVLEKYLNENNYTVDNSELTVSGDYSCAVAVLKNGRWLYSYRQTFTYMPEELKTGGSYVESHTGPVDSSGSDAVTKLSPSDGEIIRDMTDQKKMSLACPALKIPKDNAVVRLSPVVLKWSSSKNARLYKVLVSDRPDFPVQTTSAVNVNATVSKTQNETFTNQLELLGKKYYWKVGAYTSETDTDPAWSKVFSFTSERELASPVILTPKANACTTENTVTFSWRNVDGADKYEVRVSRSPKFTKYDTLPEVTATSIGYVPPDRAWKTYYWKVRAKSGTNTGEWAAGTFVGCKELAGPQLLSPEKGVTIYGDHVDLAWLQVEGAEKYKIQVSNDLKFSKPREFITTSLHYSLGKLSLKGEAYVWRVCGVRDNSSGPWSCSCFLNERVRKNIESISTFCDGMGK